LWRIASRVCLDAEKRTRRAAIQPIDNLNLTASSDPADELITREEVGAAWQAMNALSPRQRLLLYLREVQGQDYKSIAAALEMSVTAVAVNLLRSRRALASSFDKFIDSPSERCDQSRHVMAVLIDGEADAISRRSLAAHLDSCKDCQLEYRRLRRVSRMYRAFPLVQIGPQLAPAASGMTAISSGLPAWEKVAGTLASVFERTRALLAAPVVGTAVVFGTLLGPAGDSPTLAPAAPGPPPYVAPVNVRANAPAPLVMSTSPTTQMGPTNTYGPAFDPETGPRLIPPSASSGAFPSVSSPIPSRTEQNVSSQPPVLPAAEPNQSSVLDSVLRGVAPTVTEATSVLPPLPNAPVVDTVRSTLDTVAPTLPLPVPSLPLQQALPVQPISPTVVPVPLPSIINVPQANLPTQPIANVQPPAPPLVQPVAPPTIPTQTLVPLPPPVSPSLPTVPRVSIPPLTALP
jgi:hypothetical protein